MLPNLSLEKTKITFIVFFFLLQYYELRMGERRMGNASEKFKRKEDLAVVETKRMKKEIVDEKSSNVSLLQVGEREHFFKHGLLAFGCEFVRNNNASAL